MGYDRCDQDGNMYSLLPDMNLGPGHSTEVLRLQSSGNDALLFRLPNQYRDARKYQINDFAVTADGEVYFLVFPLEKQDQGSQLIIPFDRLGEAKSPIRIEVLPPLS
jgi:hypothetical protein